jgi:hypothetical protein
MQQADAAGPTANGRQPGQLSSAQVGQPGGVLLGGKGGCQWAAPTGVLSPNGPVTTSRDRGNSHADRPSGDAADGLLDGPLLRTL